MKNNEKEELFLKRRVKSIFNDDFSQSAAIEAILFRTRSQCKSRVFVDEVHLHSGLHLKTAVRRSGGGHQKTERLHRPHEQP
ncbi:hypothetical protein CSA56_00455 [candidate division KSB3 bacterium]|uniref:Uncharacterized protein n=1 Tax=candidate division KSB3 bacterium TaxID=2044937 RepID=A0A2G6KLT2_9BACT|nr:MAG: hypothetical protein CSA56_00455 [candidate division KSB3 bacterium]